MTFLRTLLIMACLAGLLCGAVAVLFAWVKFAHWLAGGALWGIVVACAPVALPFLYHAAREIEARQRGA